MSYCITPEWASAAPQVRLTVTQSSSTSTQVTLEWKLEYIASSPAYTNGVGRQYAVTINGAQVKTGSYNINQVTGTKLITSGTVNIPKGTSSKSIPFSLSFNFSLQWSGVSASVKTASGSISIAAKTSYTVKYNANGGTGAPASQTKWAGTTLKLSTAKPTKTGHTFLGWSTSSTATSAMYTAGSSYTANKSATLYAVYKANTYTVKYNANGGTGAPASQTKTYGKTLTLSGTRPTRTNYVFAGWGTSTSSTTAAYQPGGSYTKNASTTLYAIWTVGYRRPKITNFTAERCSQNGTLDEFGTYVLIKFKWDTEKTVSSIKAEYKLTSASSYTNSVSITASGTTGSVSKVIGSGDFNTELVYNIRITVTDSGGSTSSIKNIGQIHYDIDLLGGGGGVAFGKPAEIPGVDFGMHINLRNNIDIYAMTATNDPYLMVGSNTNNQFFFGYGSYDAKIGSTYFDGNLIFIRSRSNINLNAPTVTIKGIEYGNQKVLWSGGYYMTASHTATLSEAISEQPNGISLIFSRYSGGANQNYQFQSFFIPKQQVKTHGACGHTFLLTDDGNFEVMAAKYLYISDTKITGHTYNGETGTGGCGIKYRNNYYVLRYVIGV